MTYKLSTRKIRFEVLKTIWSRTINQKMAVFPMVCVHRIKLYNQSAFKDIHFARAISIEYKQISTDEMHQTDPYSDAEN